jgi:hypothetical protein
LWAFRIFSNYAVEITAMNICAMKQGHSNSFSVTFLCHILYDVLHIL